VTKIYTKTGDKGETGLIGGVRVGKDTPRVRAYGEVDELNAAVGLARAFLPATEPAEAILKRIQDDLFELGAELASPADSPRIRMDRVERLEREIDQMTAELPELKHFILPGGSEVGAALHLARAVCRRAEREVVALWREHQVQLDAMKYLNRLSDHLFTLARAVNQRAAKAETPWHPQASGA
jgi:cob(I)alamin adenosyltransferase